jgi:hypothetical protein
VNGYSYSVFTDRVGWRWRWTTVCYADDDITRLAEWTGMAWTEPRAHRKGVRATKQDHLMRRDKP